jgi:multidrug efflux pump subunit AcrA (membrane-fusion protein)
MNKNKFSLKNIVLLTSLISLLLLSSCWGKNQSTSLVDENQSYSVSILAVESSEYTPVIESFGSLSFTRKTDISPAVDGIIRRILVEEGDNVDANELLAVVENIQLEIRKRQALAEITSAQAAVKLSETRYQEGRLQVEARLLNIEKLQIRMDQAKVNMEELDRTIENKRELLEVDGISQEEFRNLLLQKQSMETDLAGQEKDLEIALIGLRDQDIRAAGLRVPDNENRRKDILLDLNTRTLYAEVEVARARLVTARAELESVDILLDELEIRADSAGILGARYKEIGERITPGDPVFTTFQSEDVFATFPVQESEAAFLYQGQICEVEVPALKNRVFSAVIQVISPTIDPQSGNLQIKALIENAESNLVPGMFAKVKIITGETRERLMVPESAVLNRRGNAAELFAVVSSRAFLKEIEIASEEDGFIELVSGLKAGELFIDEPPPFLQEGMNVQAE